MMAKRSGSFPALSKLYSAGTMRRFVRSPPAPKIVMVAGGGRWSGKLLAAVAAASAPIPVVGLSPGDAVEPPVRRDEGVLSFRSTSALLTMLPNNAPAATSFSGSSKSEASLSYAALVPMLQRSAELGIRPDGCECRLIVWRPEPDIKSHSRRFSTGSVHEAIHSDIGFPHAPVRIQHVGKRRLAGLDQGVVVGDEVPH